MNLADKPIHAFDVNVRIISDDLYLVKDVDAYVLGGTEKRIWELCDGELSVGEISSRIAVDYSVSLAQAQPDVLNFLDSLLAASLIELS